MQQSSGAPAPRQQQTSVSPSPALRLPLRPAPSSPQGMPPAQATATWEAQQLLRRLLALVVQQLHTFDVQVKGGAKGGALFPACQRGLGSPVFRPGGGGP